MYVCELLCGKCVNPKRTLIQKVELSAFELVPFHIKAICNQMNGFYSIGRKVFCINKNTANLANGKANKLNRTQTQSHTKIDPQGRCKTIICFKILFL
jgi:hypothetical protein